MKKLLLVLLVASSFAYAEDSDCHQAAQKVVDKLAAHHRNSVTLSYSADKTEQAETCKAAIAAKNPDITVNLKEVEGKDKFKFSK
jgi:hypothetical protein